MDLSVIIFCYNEKGTHRTVAERSLRFLQQFTSTFEIIIVDDGSTDGSAEIADALANDYPDSIRVVHHPKNMGIGMALRTGYQTAKFEYVCAIPADGQFDITQLSVINPFDDHTYYSFYRRETSYTFYREQLSRLNRLYNQHLLGIFLCDVNWIKVYRISRLRKVNPQLTSSIIESEMCAKSFKCGALPLEIPSDYLQRTSGTSKGGGLKTVWRALTETGKLFRVVWKFRA